MAEQADDRRYITVSAVGEVQASADVAIINFGINTEHQELATAKTQNDDILKRFMNILNSENIAKNSISYSNVYAHPQYDYTDGKNKLRGYSVTRTISLKLKELDKYEQILSKLIDAGINQVTGVTFKIEKEEELRNEARMKAIDAAKARAEAISKRLDVSLGTPLSITEYESGDNGPVPMRAMGYAMAEKASNDAPEPIPEMQTISQGVTITFEIE
jgi:uncharacterized protein YggE